MRAIILAAGEGQRLRPLTLDRPKCLVEYRKKPIIDYQIETMRECGIRDIVLIKGYRQETLERPGVRYVVNRDYATTNMVWTLFCAESLFNEDLLISYGDILYGSSILKPLLESKDDFAVTVSMNWKELWLKRMEDPLKDAETMKIDEKGCIRELGKKPRSYDEIQGQYMGLFKIRKGLLPAIKKIYHEADKNAIYDGKNYRNMYMTSFIQLLIDKGIPVKAVKVTGEWLEIDHLDDLKVVCSFA